MQILLDASLPRIYSFILTLMNLLTHSPLFLLLLSSGVSFLIPAIGTAAPSLVTNGNFETWVDNQPAHWKVASKQKVTPGTEQLAGGEKKILQVEVVDGNQKGDGQILQTIKVTPNCRYKVQGQVWGDQPGLALLQIKRIQGGKEVQRINTSRNGKGWTSVEATFDSADADAVHLLLRWRQGAEELNRKVKFAEISLTEAGELSHQGSEVGPTAVPTFNSVGIYWKPVGSSAKRPVSVQYRTAGEASWRTALPLWFDPNNHDGAGTPHTAEYRGSIVHLVPGTKYEIKLQLEGGVERILQAATWPEEFKIARTVTLPSAQKETYTITEGGSEESGYVLYTPAKGEKAVWDAAGEHPVNIQVSAPFVIIRGLTLKGAGVHGIQLGDVHHVVIEHCDISGWGSTAASGQANNLNSAVYSSSPKLQNIVVQHCNLHHPRSDSNSWSQKRPGGNSSHPQGPQGISFKGGKGRYVIRYNRIHSDLEHMFNDGMGETKNFSYGGFPNRDSDIHDNYVSHCWDDGLEIEGANMNVRVWNNYIDMTYGAIGAASPSLGPVYYFRNVYGVSRKHEGVEPNHLRGHYLVKLGHDEPKWARGKMYIFHNTTLQPPPFKESTERSSGAQSGIVFTSQSKHEENITTRNNILHMRKPGDPAIKDVRLTSNNDYDYDLFDGKIIARPDAEKHGIAASPVFERATDGRLWLTPGTPGYDAGALIPNFNDNFAGKAPDMGAVETHGNDPKPLLWPEFPPPVAPLQQTAN